MTETDLAGAEDTTDTPEARYEQRVAGIADCLSAEMMPPTGDVDVIPAAEYVRLLSEWWAAIDAYAADVHAEDGSFAPVAAVALAWLRARDRVLRRIAADAGHVVPNPAPLLDCVMTSVGYVDLRRDV